MITGGALVDIIQRKTIAAGAQRQSGTGNLDSTTPNWPWG